MYHPRYRELFIRLPWHARLRRWFRRVVMGGSL